MMSPARHLTALEPVAAEHGISVVIADNHELMRRSLRRVLESAPGVTVVAEARDLALTVQHLAAHRPDVLVLDLNMPDGSSLDLVRELAGQMPKTKVVVVSVEDSLAFVKGALAAGASGYVLKEHADTELADAVSAVSRGMQYVSPPIARRLTEARRALTGGRLSARETEVLRLIALGHTNTEIATQLGISARTVETHRAHLHRKLAARTRAQLVAYALRCGLMTS
jgi:two-component system response regulator NreC